LEKKMRFALSAAVLALIVSVSPALAQNQQGNVQYVPVYNAGNNPVYFAATPQGGTPVYNNTSAPPVPLKQMIAGKNAPSYVYKDPSQVQPYNFQSGGNAYQPQGTMTPQEEAAIRAQQYQEQLMNSLGQNGQNMGGVSTEQSILAGGGAPIDFSTLTGGPFGNTQQQQARPTKKRVLYKERNNPLVTPPRLFNPDQ
jgi:hypothetical protein